MLPAARFDRQRAGQLWPAVRPGGFESVDEAGVEQTLTAGTDADALHGSPALAYAHQRGMPVRAILATPLATPLDESDSPSSALPANPYRLGRGPVPAFAGHSSFVTALAWLDAPGRLLLTGSRDGVVKVWRCIRANQVFPTTVEAPLCVFALGPALVEGGACAAAAATLVISSARVPG
jgi:hypothetical protein